MFAIEPGKRYAVLTGDIIDSSSLTTPERKTLPDTVGAVSDALVEWLGPDTITPIALFGGDSWQVLLSAPGDALRAGLFVRASLLASPLNVDTRLAVGVGGVDFVPESGIEGADGEAFRLSGRMLPDAMPKSCDMAFATHDPTTTAAGATLFHLIDALVRTNWTANRARAVSGALRGLSGTEIGKLWPEPITKQTVSRHLDEAGWDAIDHACRFLQEALRRAA